MLTSILWNFFLINFFQEWGIIFLIKWLLWFIYLRVHSLYLMPIVVVTFWLLFDILKFRLHWFSRKRIFFNNLILFGVKFSQYTSLIVRRRLEVRWWLNVRDILSIYSYRMAVSTFSISLILQIYLIFFQLFAHLWGNIHLNCILITIFLCLLTSV